MYLQCSPRRSAAFIGFKVEGEGVRERQAAGPRAAFLMDIRLRLKDLSPFVRACALDALASLGAREFATDILPLIKDEHVNFSATWALHYERARDAGAPALPPLQLYILGTPAPDAGRFRANVASSTLAPPLPPLVFPLCIA